MIKPVQRIPRYELLVKRDIKRLAEKINKGRRSAEEAEREARVIQEIEAHIEGATNKESIQKMIARLDEDLSTLGQISKLSETLSFPHQGVWLALQGSAQVRLYHTQTLESLTEVDVAPAVHKMLAGADAIIRQHKAACLRITALLACKDLLWIGTSAGNQSQSSSIDGGSLQRRDSTQCRASTHIPAKTNHLVISGGDGYEDFRLTNSSETVGRDDSTNHLLLWRV
ncbi:hypothetical protein GOODEAATRI_000299 [Goodea atripinnis]|uniref:DH domain-containing protein n=1 Tax=Goodea atripinnis TaxID=208336 RepID=A0ABV0MDU0_9TELE